MSKRSWHFSLFLSFTLFFCLATSPLLVCFPSLTVLCSCRNTLFTERSNQKIILPHIIPKQKGLVFPRALGKPQKFPHITTCPTRFFLCIAISDVFICLGCEALLWFLWFRLFITIHLPLAIAVGIHCCAQTQHRTVLLLHTTTLLSHSSPTCQMRLIGELREPAEHKPKQPWI